MVSIAVIIGSGRNIKLIIASIRELLAVNDDLHEHYYGKANYYKAANLIPRAKWLQNSGLKI